MIGCRCFVVENMVKVLDDDEADFLDYVDKVRMDEERQKRLEEAKELSEFRTKVAEIRDQNMDAMIKQEIGLVKPDKKASSLIGGRDESPSIGVKKASQTKLLAGIVKRKSQQGSVEQMEDSSPPEKKTKLGK
jgi:hypothetical protein